MRRALVSLAVSVLVVATVLAAGTGAAQAPNCTAIALSHTAPAAFQPGATQEVLVHVSEEPGTAEAHVTVRTQIPDGWTVEPEEAEVVVPAGGEETATFTVTAPDDAEQAAQFNVTAQGTCGLNGNAFPNRDVMSTNTVTDTIVLDVDVQSGFSFVNLGTVLEMPPEYFLGAGGILVVAAGAIVALRRRGGGFEVRAVEPEKTLRPGRGTSFPIEVRARGRETDTAEFVVADPPEGWNAFMAVPEVTVNAGEARTVWLMVRAPRDATANSAAIVNVTVRSRQNAKHTTRVAVRAEVQDQVPEATGDVDSTRPA